MNNNVKFWNEIFREGPVWEFEPADSAIYAANYFHKEGLNTVLIPGIGYGRNVKPFLNKGIVVEGIEISSQAIGIARKHGCYFHIHHGSVLDMPFSNKTFDGIYCYSVLHLFNKIERSLILKKSYNQLTENGCMVFVVISTKTSIYGKGRLLSRNRYKVDNGLAVYFYDSMAIEKQFTPYGLVSYEEIDEPIKHMLNEPPLKCYMVICKKTA